MSDKKTDLVEDVKQVRDSVNDTFKAVDKMVADGNSRVLGPAATKALLKGKALLEKVSDRLFKRADDVG